jgi:hypothetical protein
VGPRILPFGSSSSRLCVLCKTHKSRNKILWIDRTWSVDGLRPQARCAESFRLAVPSRRREPECLRTAQLHRPITDLPSLPRYLHLKFGPNQANVIVIKSHNALPICNSEYAIAIVLVYISVHPNDFNY